MISAGEGVRAGSPAGVETGEVATRTPNSPPAERSGGAAATASPGHMTQDQYDDVRTEIWCEPWKAPGMFEDMTSHVVTELGYMATSTCRCYPGGVSPASYEGPQRHCPVHGEPAYWARCLLLDLQGRAKSGVPFGEPHGGDLPPTNPEDL